MAEPRSAVQVVLLAGLLPGEIRLIEDLIAAFAMEALVVPIAALNQPDGLSSEDEICLAVLHIDEHCPRPRRTIRRLQTLLARPVPLIILVAPSRAGAVGVYIRAGADDYALLPLDRDSFSVRFYILLEWGQAMLQAIDLDDPWEEFGEAKAQNLWGRLVARLREGLGFFAPAGLLQNRRSGQIFNRWQKIRSIGRGGFGDVWLVEDRHHRQAVAKIPHGRELNLRTLRSAAILKRLVHHPNIVHLLEVIKDEGKFILIQEYIDGQTLDQCIEQGLDAVLKESIFKQLLSVIVFAHRHRILHRDIKPENILVTPEGQVKLLDFGIARDLSWQTAGQISEGTLNFMAPEQLQGRSCLASDVWSLGIILYVLATDCYPFFQQNSLFPGDAQVESRVPAPHQLDCRVSGHLERIILTCLEIDLAGRYVDAMALQADLRQTLPDFGKGLILPEHRRREGGLGRL